MNKKNIESIKELKKYRKERYKQEVKELERSALLDSFREVQSNVSSLRKEVIK